MKLLIVDDSPKLRALMIQLLGQNDREFIECGNGEAALDEYRNSRPDVVLMDIAMPVLGGLEAAARIRQFDPDAAIVIVSDYDEPMFRERAHALGITHYILKEHLVSLNETLLTLPGAHNE